MRLTSQQVEVVEEAVGLLFDGFHAFLSGYHLSGRTTVLNAVAQRLTDRGARVLRVSASPDLKRHPFGALSMSGIAIPHGAGPAHVLAALREHLGATAALLIDDVDQLDPESLAVLRSVIGTSRIPVVGTGGPPTSGPANGLSREARVLTVPALRFADVHALMRESLGRVIHHSAVARILLASGGLAGLVAALTAEAHRTGRFHDSAGGLLLDRDLYLPRLSGLIWSFLSELGEAHVEAVALLSVVRPLGLTESSAVVAPQVVIDLEQSGLLRVVATRTGPVLSVFPPIIAETMRHELPPGRTLLLAERLAEALPAQPEEEVGSALLRGLPLWTAEESNSTTIALTDLVGDQRRDTLKVTRDAWTRDPSALNAYPYLRALHDLGAEASLVYTVIDRTRAGEDDRADALLVSWRATYLAYADGDLDGSRALLQAARTRLPRFAAFLRAVEAFQLFAFDRVPPESLLADPEPSEDQLGREGVAVVRAQVRLAQGRIAEARHELGRVTPTYLYFQVSHAMSSVLASVFDGDLDGALSTAAHHLNVARAEFDISALTAHGYAAGLALYLGGRMTEFRTHFTTMMSFPQLPLLQVPYLSGLLTFAVTDALSRHQLSYAEALGARSASLGIGDGPFPGMTSSVVDSLLRAARGDDDPTGLGAQIWAVAQDRLARGYVVHGLAAGLAAQDQDPTLPVTRTLREATRDVDPGALTLLVDFAEAVETNDASALAAVATRFEAAQMPAYACLAHACALRSQYGQGVLAGLSAKAVTLSLLARDHGIETDWVFARLVDDIALSTREWEVAALLADGLTNQDIAAQLVIGTRTAESHVQSIFRKTGVENRRELAQALHTWLRPSER